MAMSRSQLSAAAVFVGIGAVFFVVNRFSRAADEEEKARDTILKMVDDLAKNNVDAARTEAKELKDTDLDDIMPLFGKRTPRNKKALGMGPTPGAIQPDGIELKIEQLGRKQLAAGDAAAQASAIEQAAYVAAAIALVIQDKCPVPAKQGNKDPSDWKRWSDDMEKASLELAAAAKQKNAASVHKAADRLDATCKSCHAPFK